MQAMEEAEDKMEERISSKYVPEGRVVVRYAASYHGNSSPCHCCDHLQTIRGYNSTPRISQIDSYHGNHPLGATYEWARAGRGDRRFICKKCGNNGGSVFSREKVADSSLRNFNSNNDTTFFTESREL